MANHGNLFEVENDLKFIARTLQSGYLDLETVEELSRAAHNALRSLADYKGTRLPTNVVPFPLRRDIYEPPSAA